MQYLGYGGIVLAVVIFFGVVRFATGGIISNEQLRALLGRR